MNENINNVLLYLVERDVLLFAVERGFIDVVKCLIEQGADVTARDNEALILAAGNGYLDVVEYLKSKGCKL